MAEEIKMFASEGITKSNRMLHTPSTFAKENLLYVQEVGKLESLTPHWCERSNIESYLFLVVLDGKGVLKADGGVEYELSDGDCVLIDCHENYAHCSSQENPWKLAWVHFYGQQAKAYYSFFREQNQTPVFHAADDRVYEEMIEQLMGLQGDKDVYAEIASAGILSELLTQVLMALKSREYQISAQLFEQIRVYISENYMKDSLLSEISEKFAVQDVDIQSEFSKRYGIELWDYILNRKYTVAKEMLRFSIKPIAEIVTESGICNTDLFYQLFKQNEGMTPEDYRRKWAQWVK